MENLEEIKKNTKEFREQKDNLFIGVGKELAEKGVDINKIIVVDFFTEDNSKCYFVVVTKDRCIFEFYYDYLHKNETDGKIIGWQEFTKNPEKVYMNENVEIALEFFDQF